MNKKILPIVLIVLTYLLSAGISYSLFAASGSEAPPSTEVAKEGNDFEALTFDQKSRTEECPLNGAKYSKEQRKWWESHRPLGVMIENHTEARPQSGLSFADIIYEAIAEGGITRFLTVFYCQDGGIVGPVRSARTYFVDFISEYGEYPLYAHVGGANCDPKTGSGCLNGAPADAIGQIRKYGWTAYNDMDQFALGYPTYKQIEDRNGRDVAVEHTVYSNTSRLWAAAKKRGITDKDEEGNAWDEDFEKYEFKDDPKASDLSASQSIHVEYWNNPDFYVDWIYDPKSNSYLRKHGGEEHLDRNTKKQLAAKNVVILLMRESRANDGYEGNLHMLYGNKGTGKALIFIDGKEVKGTWKKADRQSRLMVYDSAGKEVVFTRGLIWFHVLATDGVVDVE